jgi:hypothetical protein
MNNDLRRSKFHERARGVLGSIYDPAKGHKGDKSNSSVLCRLQMDMMGGDRKRARISRPERKEGREMLRQ